MSRTRLLVLAAAGALAARAARGPGMPTDDLTGRTAVVTGGGSGIGRALCLLLAQRGARVHVVDRDGARAEAVAAELGFRGTAHEVDVTDAAAVSALADAVFADGPVDLLFNNAGVGHAGPVVETPLEDWERVVAVNLMGVVHGVHVFLPRLLQQGRPAAVVNTASMAGLLPNPGMVPYSATKAAVLGLSDALDQEVREHGVRVHALCPGVIATDIIRTAVMRGDMADKQAGVQQLYATRGTSPDVVARDALSAVARGQVVVPTPRYQVVPPWLVKRLSPALGAALSTRLLKGLADRG